MLYGVANSPQTLMIVPGRLSDQALLKLLVELSLSILVILAHFASDSPRTLPATISAKPACVLAAAYTAATLVSNPFLNPARALGPAFVMNKWDNHWVYWIGPIAGGAIATLLHEYVLSNNRRSRDPRDLEDGDNSSMRSDDETYDDLDKAGAPKFPGSYATYRPVAGASSIYGPPPTALERVESIYGGTKSLYCKSPPLTRANLNRSQSVYAKSTSGTRDGLILPKPGPLVPAQSLYPIRLNSVNTQSNSREGQSTSQQATPPSTQQTSQNHNSTNQNMQNQLQQCTQNIYGIRGITTSLSTRDNIYGHLGTRENGGISTSPNIYARAPAPPPSNHGPSSQQQVQPQQNVSARENVQIPNQVPSPHQNQLANDQDNGPRRSSDRPESMYGHVRRGDDSAYGSYQSSSRGTYGKAPGPPPPGWTLSGGGRSSQTGSMQNNPGQQQGNYQRHSPNPPQY